MGFLRYEVYLDLFFLENLIMDFYLLWLVRRIRGQKTSVPRCIGGAAIGAALLCLLVCLPVGCVCFYFLAHAGINTVMIMFGCRIQNRREWFGALAALYGVSFFAGGMLLALSRAAWFRGAARQAVIFAAFALADAGICLARKARRQRERYVPFCLYAGGRCREGVALIDTGNGLYDSISRRPVSVCSYEFLSSLLPEEILAGLEKMERGETDATVFGRLAPHFIAYSGLGCEGGVALAVTMDYLCLERGGEKKLIQKPVVAFSTRNRSFGKHCQIILHPQLID